jgi:O-antigen/teichoic acid export membrane protein
MTRSRIPVVVGNTGAQLVGKVISAGVTFVSLALISRRFGPQGIGEYTLVLAFLGLFFLLVDAGFNAIVVQKVVKTPRRLNKEFNLLLGTRLSWAMILVFVGWLTVIWLPYSKVFKIGVLILSLAIPFQAIGISANAVFQARLTYVRASIAGIVGSLVTFLLTFWVVASNLSVYELFAAVLLGTLSSAVSALALLKGLGITVRLGFSTQGAERLIRATLPLALTLFLNLLAFKADAFLLAYFVPITEVGIYNLAYKVFENVIALPIFILNSLYPLLVSDRVSGLTKLKRSSRQAAAVLLGLGLVISGILIVVSPLVISLLGGREFTDSIFLLRTLLVGLPLFFLSALTMWLLIALERTWFLVGIYGSALVVNLVLNLMFIPRFGSVVAAINTGVTETFILAISGYLVVRELEKEVY